MHCLLSSKNAVVINLFVTLEEDENGWKMREKEMQRRALLVVLNQGVFFFACVQWLIV